MYVDSFFSDADFHILQEGRSYKMKSNIQFKYDKNGELLHNFKNMFQMISTKQLSNLIWNYLFTYFALIFIG